MVSSGLELAAHRLRSEGSLHSIASHDWPKLFIGDQMVAAWVSWGHIDAIGKRNHDEESARKSCGIRTIRFWTDVGSHRPTVSGRSAGPLAAPSACRRLGVGLILQICQTDRQE